MLRECVVFVGGYVTRRPGNNNDFEEKTCHTVLTRIRLVSVLRLIGISYLGVVEDERVLASSLGVQLINTNHL